MMPNRGQWGQRGQSFSRADQQDTVISSNIFQNQYSEARVTVRTLSPLSPLPPFWVVDDPLPSSQLISARAKAE